MNKQLSFVATAATVALAFVAAVSHAKDGDWPMPGLNYQLTRFSPLNQITIENAK